MGMTKCAMCERETSNSVNAVSNVTDEKVTLCDPCLAGVRHEQDVWNRMADMGSDDNPDPTSEDKGFYGTD